MDPPYTLLGRNSLQTDCSTIDIMTIGMMARILFDLWQLQEQYVIGENTPSPRQGFQGPICVYTFSLFPFL